jgi:hypothetical protein
MAELGGAATRLRAATMEVQNRDAGVLNCAGGVSNCKTAALNWTVD